MHPKAFISRASEDKSRFVVRFAERLRANGVDARLDCWEMLPGSSGDTILNQTKTFCEQAADVRVQSQHCSCRP